LAGDHLPSIHHQQGGDGLHLEALGQLGRLVHVHLHQLHLAREVPGELLERRADHAAGTAPGRPEVDHHGDRRFLGDAGEVVVTGIRNPRQRRVTLTASRAARHLGRHPVLATAALALDDF